MVLRDQLERPKVETRPPGKLRPAARNARRHSRKQIKQIAESIKRFGFLGCVLITEDDEIIAGHGRVDAAISMGLTAIPVILVSHLSEAERRAFMIADNKLALNAGWDQEMLAIEFQALIDLDFDVTLTGFSQTEIDLTLDAAQDAKTEGFGPEDEIPPLAATAVSRPGDLWIMDRHRLVCGDARERAHYDYLMDGGRADLVFTDPPYNVPIDGNVGGLGRFRHREFAMGVGEMSETAFTAFLAATLGLAAAVCRDGAIAFVCMDWRHIGELVSAGRATFNELKNICVWNKTNGGMGTFYRSKHEMICVFKVGTAAHVNNFGLGNTGRYRTNVWDYPGISSLGAGRDEALEMHPTVKPTALVADAIRDCSRRGDIVLDPFAGSGTTLIAAQLCGRSARLIEFDPLYCDTIVRRYQRVTGKTAVMADGGLSFEAAEMSRVAEGDP